MKARKIESALLRKGFVKHEGDHSFFVLMVDGRTTSIRTKISHGERDIESPLLEQIQKQVRLKKRDFEDLVNCPLSKEGYIGKLKATGNLSI